MRYDSRGVAQYAKGELGGRSGRGTARMLSATNNHL
jgi:hypothetical protein